MRKHASLPDSVGCIPVYVADNTLEDGLFLLGSRGRAGLPLGRLLLQTPDNTAVYWYCIVGILGFSPSFISAALIHFYSFLFLLIQHQRMATPEKAVYCCLVTTSAALVHSLSNPGNTNS